MLVKHRLHSFRLVRNRRCEVGGAASHAHKLLVHFLKIVHGPTHIALVFVRFPQLENPSCGVLQVLHLLHVPDGADLLVAVQIFIIPGHKRDRGLAGA